MCLATLACSLVLSVPGPMAVPTPQSKPELAKVLAEWHRRYRKGILTLQGIARENGRDERLYGYGHLPPNTPAHLDHAEALELLLAKALELQTTDVCKEVLHLATVGMGEHRLPPHRLATRVRATCLDALGQFSDASSLDLLQRIGSGDREAWDRRDWNSSIQSAALLALGRIGRSVFRPTLEAQLQVESPEVQSAAGEALGLMRLARSLPALTRALAKSKHPRVCQTLIEANVQIIEAHQDTLGSAEIRDALAAAIDKLGHGDWRSDLVVIGMLEKYRTLPSIPALIRILERFTNAPDRVESDQLSGILQHRAHELLSSMTGALIPKDRPDKWKEFWERERDGFQLAPVRDEHVKKPRTSAGFFGIPVLGRRVVYVIDTSGSMKSPHYREVRSRTATPRKRDSRLHLAKTELRSSVFALAEGTEFALVFFADKASRWRRELTSVTQGSLSSLSAKLKTLQAEGGTNIYSALLSAFTLRNTGRYGKGGLPAEEIFLLSDGRPSAGELIDPESILEAIAEANHYLQIRINTIYIGGGDSAFMRKLAEQSGGSYVTL